MTDAPANRAVDHHAGSDPVDAARDDQVDPRLDQSGPAVAESTGRADPTHTGRCEASGSDLGPDDSDRENLEPDSSDPVSSNSGDAGHHDPGQVASALARADSEPDVSAIADPEADDVALGTPSADVPTVAGPASGAATADAPIVDASAIRPPPGAPPVADRPVGDSQIADPPVAALPVGDSQIAELQAAEPPVADVPSAEPPVADAPAAPALVTSAAAAPPLREPDEAALRLAEAAVFASTTPMTPRALSQILPDDMDPAAVIIALRSRYEGRGLELCEIGGGLQFRTAADLAPRLRKVVQVPRRLPRVALETLAIVAYHQPITRPEIEDLRGTGLSQQTLDALLENDLIVARGRKETPGRPTLWGTTTKFLEYFGLRDIRELPRRQDLLLEAVRAETESETAAAPAAPTETGEQEPAGAPPA